MTCEIRRDRADRGSLCRLVRGRACPGSPETTPTCPGASGASRPTTGCQQILRASVRATTVWPVSRWAKPRGNGARKSGRRRSTASMRAPHHARRELGDARIRPRGVRARSGSHGRSVTRPRTVASRTMTLTDSESVVRRFYAARAAAIGTPCVTCWQTTSRGTIPYPPPHGGDLRGRDAVFRDVFDAAGELTGGTTRLWIEHVLATGRHVAALVGWSSTFRGRSMQRPRAGRVPRRRGPHRRGVVLSRRPGGGARVLWPGLARGRPLPAGRRVCSAGPPARRRGKTPRGLVVFHLRCAHGARIGRQNTPCPAAP